MLAGAHGHSQKLIEEVWATVQRGWTSRPCRARVQAKGQVVRGKSLEWEGGGLTGTLRTLPGAARMVQLKWG